MKKYFVLALILTLVLCGCGKKNKNVSKKVEESYIGSEDLKYTLSINCKDKTKDSSVTLNKNGKAAYEIYECNNDILELTTGSGTYTVKDDTVKIKDEYSSDIKLKVINDETIEVTVGDITQTLTK